MASPSQDVLDRVEREKDTSLEQLKDFLRIPSISTDPDYKQDVLRCSEFVRARMSAAGLAAESIETAGNPLVYAEWNGAPGKPTVLFYGHYDVQPVDPIEEWRNPPFEPTLEGDRLVARGATDDKGQSFAHLKAVEAMLGERGRLPVNVKFIIEGEEESGGAAIDAYVRADAKQRLACDAVVISDSSMYAPGQPSMLYGLRGLAYMEVRVTGPDHDLHSGTFGGAVSNPLNALGDIIASLRDPATGRILIPGFYDDVRPLEAWEREEFAKLPFDEAAYRREIGVSALLGEEGYSVRERTCARPTCDVNGIWGGYQGKGAKTVLPARAGAKISMRLVPDQQPEKIAELFAAHVQRVAPRGVTVEVSAVHGAGPVLIEAQGPLIEAALDAMEETWGARPVRVREGGSIPIVGTFAEVLQVPILLLGFGLEDDRLHSPNEKFNLESVLWRHRRHRASPRPPRGSELKAKPSVERELKFAAVEPDRLRERLRELEAERVHPGALEDNWVLDNGGKLQRSNCVLRLRKDSHGAFLTFKGPATFEGKTKLRAEHETGVSDADATRKLFESLGFAVVKRYQKVRESWQLGGVTISLDHTPIGEFAEFEGEGAEKVARRCELDPEEAERRSYLRLYADHLAAHPDAPPDMVFADRE